MTASKNLAIQTALTGDWQKAIQINEELLLENPEDIDTLNRLAYAWSSTGDIKKAKGIYQKVLSMDTQNPIASRNLKRLNGSSQGQVMPASNLSSMNLFIEEPGKTKVIELINVADKKMLTTLRSGEKVDLQVKRMKIFVVNPQKQFIGMLPDDLSKRLIKFIEAGNQYEGYVRNSHDNKVTIFVRETKRVIKYKDQPSFISFEKNKLVIKSIADANHFSDRDDE